MLLHLLIVVVGASVIASFTDWIFMGVLFHDKYLVHPEAWRTTSGEATKIVISQLIGVISCLALAVLFLHVPQGHRPIYFALAGLVWFVGVVPMAAQNVVWMKLHPLIGFSHTLGWLMRYLITAGLATWLF